MTPLTQERHLIIDPHVQDRDAVGLSGGEGLDKALQLKKKLLEFDQTRYVYMCIYVHDIVHVYVCMYICMCVHMYVCMYVCTYVCMYVNTFVHVGMWCWNAEHVCMYVCLLSVSKYSRLARQ